MSATDATQLRHIRKPYPGSRAPRVYDAPIGEQNTNQNFYCGTFVSSPSPGTYEDAESLSHTQLQRVKTPTFSRCTSPRIMSTSRCVWSPHEYQHETPAPFAYDVLPSSTEHMVRSKIATSKHDIFMLREKQRQDTENGRPASPQVIEEIENIKNKVRDLKTLLTSFDKEKILTARLPKKQAKYVAFGVSDIRDCNRPAKPILKPHFYLAERDWTPGVDSTERTINMNSFKHTDKYKLEVLTEILLDHDVLGEARRPSSRCRSTDFFGTIPNNLIKERLPESTLNAQARRLYSHK